MSNFQTTYHRDRTVTVWDVYSQSWERTSVPADTVLASLSYHERVRVRRHTCSISREQIEALQMEARLGRDDRLWRICMRAILRGPKSESWRRCKDIIHNIT